MKLLNETNVASLSASHTICLLDHCVEKANAGVQIIDTFRFPLLILFFFNDSSKAKRADYCRRRQVDKVSLSDIVYANNRGQSHHFRDIVFDIKTG